jgi:hypothetical protein
MDFLEHLAQAVEKTGHTIERGDSSLVVSPLQITVESRTGQAEIHANNDQVIQISIKASHQQEFPEGIWESLAGLGKNEDEAFSYAAEAWTTGVFPPIHDVLMPAELPGFAVPRCNLVTRNEASGELFPWQVYLGPLQATESFPERGNIPEEVLLKQMFNAMTGELISQRLIWIKAFVAKLPDGSIHADCWLNNQNWIEGLNALYWFAEELPRVEAYAALKQFMIVKPCDWNTIENAEELKQSLPPRSPVDS